MKITFSVLHFGSASVTEDCIDSILGLESIADVDVNIVVVNNGTNNGSREILLSKYSKINNFYLLDSPENLGFAKGNNLGYLFAKNKLFSDVICVLNNDITITQKDFLGVLMNAITTIDSAIIAPSIINSAGNDQNPLRQKRLTNKEISWGLFYNRTMRLIYRIPFINRLVAGYLERRRAKKKNRTSIGCSALDIVPHGAMIIYKNPYVTNENFAFLEDTFLFGEEDFLYDYLVSKNYHTAYCSALVVNHNEDSSIKSITGDYIKKRLFITSNKISSLKKLRSQRKTGLANSNYSHGSGAF